MVRFAVKKDIDVIYGFICGLENNALNKKKFEKNFYKNIKEKDFLVYVENEAVLGFCSLKIITPLHHENNVAEIEELFISENSRGKGIGKILLNKAEDIAKAKNCEIIELSSNQRRIDAHKFYQREGFLKTHYKLTKSLD